MKLLHLADNANMESEFEHKLIHDLESLFYILLYIVCYTDSPSKVCYIDSYVPISNWKHLLIEDWFQTNDIWAILNAKCAKMS